MFTGLVTHQGHLLKLERGEPMVLSLKASLPGNVVLGDSVAVNGACLTAISHSGDTWSFNLSGETLDRSHFADLKPGDPLNLELPLTLQAFLGGHLVSGHLDGTVRVGGVTPRAGAIRMTLIYQDSGWRRFLVPKGSITLNGVSLTLSEVRASQFVVDVIPHTWQQTNLSGIRPGVRVNAELDMLAKYLYNVHSFGRP